MTPTLTDWSAFPGGWICYWRHEDGRDTIAARVYRNGRGRWLVIMFGADGAAMPPTAPEDAKRPAVLREARARLVATLPGAPS